MTRWSVVIGLLGILTTAFVLKRLAGGTSRWTTQQYWLLGVAGLFPAWLFGFLALLGSFGGASPDTPLPPSALFSSVAALFGIIITEAAVRHGRIPEFLSTPWMCWLLGLAALLPAWGIGLWYLP